MKRAATLCLALAAAACGVPHESAWMEPGANCLDCHSGTRAPFHHVWTLAGTVFDQKDGTGQGVTDATIIITDANGTNYALSTNGAGNFYTAETLKAPWRVAVERGGKRLVMPGEISNGACNNCHTTSGPDAVGALFSP